MDAVTNPVVNPDAAEWLGQYSQRINELAGDEHHIASPLGAWLLVAQCAPLASGQIRAELTTVLGVEPETAASFAAALLEHPHPLIASAAAIWTRRGTVTDASRQSIARLPPFVDSGDLPSQAALDAWAQEHTLGLIEHFPLDPRPDTLMVLATALATRVSWQHPFDTAPASELGADSPWSSRLRQVLRSPQHGHSQFIASTARAGDVAVHSAAARDGLQVTSVIAAREVPSAEVLAAAHDIATSAATHRHVARQSLFDLPLGHGPLWTLTEHPVQTISADGHEHCTAILPAWSAETELSLLDPALGFATVAKLLAETLGVVDYRYEAKQAAVAHYTRVGFEAAAVTAVALAVSGPRGRPGRRRHAVLRFGHPYAVVAVATDEQFDANRGTTVRGPWHGVPQVHVGRHAPSSILRPPQARELITGRALHHRGHASDGSGEQQHRPVGQLDLRRGVIAGKCQPAKAFPDSKPALVRGRGVGGEPFGQVFGLGDGSEPCRGHRSHTPGWDSAWWYCHDPVMEIQSMPGWGVRPLARATCSHRTGV